MTFIEPDKIIQTKKCPFCGWKNEPSYDEDHVVNYSCNVCGLTTSFIDPNHGFDLDELPDGLSEDDFEDAVIEAESNALELYGIAQYIPDEKIDPAISVIFTMYQHKFIRDTISDIIKFDDMSVYRISESKSVKELIKQIFIYT